MGVEHLTEENFEQKVIQPKKPVIVDFFASWCGPCKAMAPIFEETGEKYQDRIEFFKVDVDECQKVAQDYGVMSIPTLIVFKDGKVIKTLVGLQDGDSIAAAVEEAE